MLSLSARSDGVPQDIDIGIKQIQLEQDTAKTVLQPPTTQLLDFNRVSHPLIEIISLPHIHDPITAAAYVRKIQAILRTIGACETGMELGGLRADVNVSVRPKSLNDNTLGFGLTYAGVTGLGQRTEIKNLATLTGISTAIALERNRQIKILASGGSVESETRGWTLGASETHRIRGKEGEVDYRYMPDSDLGPLIIGESLISFLRDTLPELPEFTIGRLQHEWGVLAKDARTLVELDEGNRCDYFFEVAHQLVENFDARHVKQFDKKRLGKTVANWTLHELGALLTASDAHFDARRVPAGGFAELLELLLTEEVTLPTAKQILAAMFDNTLDTTSASEYIDRNDLRLKPMTDTEYEELASQVITANLKMAENVKDAVGRGDTRAKGKLMWFVGQMVKLGAQGRVQPARAEHAVRMALGVDY